MANRHEKRGNAFGTTHKEPSRSRASAFKYRLLCGKSQSGIGVAANSDGNWKGKTTMKLPFDDIAVSGRFKEPLTRIIPGCSQPVYAGKIRHNSNPAYELST